MTPHTLAGPGHNPAASSAPVRPKLVTWWALVGPVDLPLTLGSTPEEAEARHYAFLLRFYREEADPPPPDPEAAAKAELARWKKGALLSGAAPDELSAFLAWNLLCPLLDDEALAEWRAVFPAPEGPDPLAELVSRGLTASASAGFAWSLKVRPHQSRPPHRVRGRGRPR